MEKAPPHLDRETYKRLLKQAIEFGCKGLIGGEACRLEDHERVYVRGVSKKDGPFYCERCYSDAIIKKGEKRRHHFAHKAPYSPVLSKGETELHKQAKNSICSCLSELFPDGKWKVERPFNKAQGKPDLVPDVSGLIGEQRLAIEIQYSSYSPEKIRKRTEGYTLWGVPLLWIVPLKHELDKPQFKPRFFERYLHGMYNGRTYYWWEGLGLSVQPIHYDPAYRWFENRSFYDEYGEEQEVGGYYKEYKVVKTPSFGPLLHIARDFSVQNHSSRLLEADKVTTPDCSLWQDTAPDWWLKDQHPQM